MSEQVKPSCPECEVDQAGLDRRTFFGAVGGTAVTLAGLHAVAPTRALGQAAATARPAAVAPRPAEALIRELYQGLSDEQKRGLVYAYDHRQGNNLTRHGMFNAAIFPNHRIAAAYTPAQRELVERILRSICNGDEGWRAISRNGTWDASQEFGACGAYIFGNPMDNNAYSWVFTGHHLTVRCDGNSESDRAFGGPIYYGHTPDGWSQRNVFFPQTRAAKEVFESLNENQRRLALATWAPGEAREQAGSVQFRARHPGLPAGEMTADQRRVVQDLMRAVLSPYRREDADEVMQLVQRNGGLERLHLAFYRDQNSTDAAPWAFWRIEGPGFVWNFRVLPHVHTFVNIGIPRNA